MQFQHAGFIVGIGLEILMAGGVRTGNAEPVGNGNELCLGYATNTPAGRQLIQKNVTGQLQTFRYLKITEIKKDTPKPGAMTLMAVEPSSTMKTVLVIDQKVSLDIAKTLAVDDCVAANGRIKSVTNNLMVLDPAMLKHKDRRSPKQAKELLHEVDPTAY